MSAILATRGVVVDDQVPCCPRCGAITGRLGIDRRQCHNSECCLVVPYKVYATGGNMRVFFSTDGSDPGPSGKRRPVRYRNRVSRT